MERKPNFEIIYLEDAMDFLFSLPEKVQDKIAYNISKSRFITDKRLFEKLTPNIWEFRTLYMGVCYRLLAFWDKDINTFVVATHGFVKKTNKTPLQEIAKAENIRIQYFKDKKSK